VCMCVRESGRECSGRVFGQDPVDVHISICVRESERESECEKVYVFVCERASERVSV